MRTILEIVTFHTPIDSLEITESKEQKIRSMIEDFLKNSGENFEKKNTSNEQYEVYSYIHTNILIHISIKHDAYMDNYITPHFLVAIETTHIPLEKSIIEDFLNTIIRFFSGTLIEQYFLDYDSTYHLETMNQGKKYSIEDISSIHAESLKNSKNKNLLDSILYLHYSLEKRIIALGIHKNDLDIFLSGKDTRGYSVGVISLMQERTDITASNLLKNINTLHKQIQVILSYFTKPS